MNTKDFIANLPHCEFELLNSDDTFKFTCTGCGECCRNLKNVVMVEPLDLFRIAKHFGINIEDAAKKYVETVMLTWGYPVFTLKTKQHMDACIFLRNGRCSIYNARPRVCRLYPLNTGPDDDNPEAFTNIVDVKRKHHYIGTTYCVNEWMDEHFSMEDREFLRFDFKFAAEFAKLRKNIDQSETDRIEQIMLLYRYMMFDTSEDFIPQYLRNLAVLKAHLKRL